MVIGNQFVTQKFNLNLVRWNHLQDFVPSHTSIID